MLHVTFVMEQHIGHQTYYQNLRRFVDAVPELDAAWVPVTYDEGAASWAGWRFLPQNLRGTLNGRFQVRKGLKQTASDVVLFNTQVPAAIAGNLAQKRPYILCTDITPIQYDQIGLHYNHQADNNSVIRRYKHRVNVKLMHGAARILPWSYWTRTSLIQDYGVDLSKIEVIPPGIDLQLWRPKSRPANKTVHILFVGGDFYRKGGDILLAAFQCLAPGSAELHMVTRSRLDPEPHIHIYNHMQPNSPELIALYQTADIFVLPTKAEAFGIAAVEASAVGLPVVATAVGGLTDIVVDGETGFLVKPADKTGLAQCLHKLITNPNLRQQMGAAARQHAAMQFDTRHNAARIIEILGEVKRQGNSR